MGHLCLFSEELQLIFSNCCRYPKPQHNSYSTPSFSLYESHQYRCHIWWPRITTLCLAAKTEPNNLKSGMGRRPWLWQTHPIFRIQRQNRMNQVLTLTSDYGPTREVESSIKGAFSLRKRSLLLPHNHLSPLFNWPFNLSSSTFCWACLGGTFMNPMWNNDNKLLA